MIKACIFDLDGTLADTLESIAAATNKALNAVGLKSRPKDDYRYFAGDGAKTLVERALKAAGDCDGRNFDKAYEIYCRIFEEDCTFNVRVFDGMKETLETLKAKGMKLAVLSNKPHERTKDVIFALFGKDLFDYVQGQVENVPKKPDPAGAFAIAGNFNVLPEECLYAGDTNVDMQTGNNAGMFTVGVLWGFRDKKELLYNHAHALAAKPEDLVALAEADGRQAGI